MSQAYVYLWLASLDILINGKGSLLGACMPSRVSMLVRGYYNRILIRRRCIVVHLYEGKQEKTATYEGKEMTV